MSKTKKEKADEKRAFAALAADPAFSRNLGQLVRDCEIALERARLEKENPK